MALSPSPAVAFFFQQLLSAYCVLRRSRCCVMVRKTRHVPACQEEASRGSDVSGSIAQVNAGCWAMRVWHMQPGQRGGQRRAAGCRRGRSEFPSEEGEEVLSGCGLIDKPRSERITIHGRWQETRVSWVREKKT